MIRILFASAAFFAVGYSWGQAARRESFALKPDRDFEHVIGLHTVSRFEVENAIGGIEVSNSPGDRITLSGHYGRLGKAKEDATLRFEESEEGTIRIWIDYPEGAVNGATRSEAIAGHLRSPNSETTFSFSSGSGVELKLAVPERYWSAFRIGAELGSVSMHGFDDQADEIHRSVGIRNGHGNIRAERINIAGGFKLETQLGAIKAVEIAAAGGVELVSSLGNLVASDILSRPGIALRTTGRIHADLVRSEGPIIATSGLGTIELSRFFATEVYVRNETGSVTGLAGTTEAGIRIATEQGTVELAGVEAGGPVWASSAQGGVKMKKVSSPVGIRAETELGPVTIKENRAPSISITGNSVAARSNVGNLVITGRMGSVVARSNSGHIRATNEIGLVSIKEQTGGQVYARTGMGEIVLANPEALLEDARTAMGSVQGQRKKGVCTAVLAEVTVEIEPPHFSVEL